MNNLLSYKATKKRRSRLNNRQDLQKLTMLILPFIKILLFSFIPMVGLVIAFQNYKPLKLFASDFVGLDNFKFIFQSPDLPRILFNSVIINVLCVSVSTVLSVLLALFLKEVKNRYVQKGVQSMFFLPYFVAWPVVGTLLVSMIGDKGLLTNLIVMFGGPKIDFYQKSEWWRAIIVFINTWKYAGFSAIGYYALLMGVDPQMYEAADIDGAGTFKKMIHISLPNLSIMVMINLITSASAILRVDFGLIYFTVGGNNGLYNQLEVFETYLFKAMLKGSQFGQPVAMGMFQSVVGLALALAANYIIKRISPEQAMF